MYYEPPVPPFSAILALQPTEKHVIIYKKKSIISDKKREIFLIFEYKLQEYVVKKLLVYGVRELAERLFGFPSSAHLLVQRSAHYP